MGQDKKVSSQTKERIGSGKCPSLRRGKGSYQADGLSLGEARGGAMEDGEGL